ncbi:hypothetical protein, partial [Catellatospora sp. NPDC049609]|uniref:hypothetical protein n=1 Tax=Catellatospora sp. NPDC049609 TaxID=3155505 RepID=UPI00343CF433
ASGTSSSQLPMRERAANTASSGSVTRDGNDRRRQDRVDLARTVGTTRPHRAKGQQFAQDRRDLDACDRCRLV